MNISRMHPILGVDCEAAATTAYVILSTHPRVNNDTKESKSVSRVCSNVTLHCSKGNIYKNT